MPLRKTKKQRAFQSSSHARAPRQEKELGKRIGGRTVRGSGSGYEKGDARKEGVIRIECKTTKAKSFSVTRDMFAKIEDAAMGAGEIPVMEIEFLDDGQPVGSLCVAPSWAIDLLAAKREQEKEGLE